MKIIFDNQIFNTQVHGGISRYFCELVNNLDKLNSMSHIYAGIHINQYLMGLSRDLYTGQKIESYLPMTRRFFRYINALCAKRFAKKYLPDIVHETYYSPNTIAPKSVKKVVTVYDMIHEKFPNQFSSNDRTSELKAVSVSRADHVICISEQTKKDLIYYFGTPENKISVVYLGHELSVDKSDVPANFTQTLRPFLLYVGQRNGYKNFMTFIEAYAESQDLKTNYDVVSFGGGCFNDVEKKTFADLGLSENQVRQVSGNDELLASYYSQASLFVYPSLYEGFGIPPLEAMNYDCPVVCSSTSSLPEVVGNAAHMFIPESSKSIRLAMESVINDPEYRSQLINLGRERVKMFSWEKCALETAAVYKMVTS